MVRIIADTLCKGGLFIFPTDTVYGIGCNLFMRRSVGRIYSLKGRGYSKPLPILIHDARDLSILTKEVPKETGILIKEFWPGPLTLVFQSSLIASIATGGRSTVALRLPSEKFLLKVLKTVKMPLASTSANLSGNPALSSGREVIRQFNGRVEIIADGGKTQLGVPSTVLDLSNFPFTVRREGAVPKKKLLEIVK